MLSSTHALVLQAALICIVILTGCSDNESSSQGADRQLILDPIRTADARFQLHWLDSVSAQAELIEQSSSDILLELNPDQSGDRDSSLIIYEKNNALHMLNAVLSYQQANTPGLIIKNPKRIVTFNEDICGLVKQYQTNAEGERVDALSFSVRTRSGSASCETSVDFTDISIDQFGNVISTNRFQILGGQIFNVADNELNINARVIFNVTTNTASFVNNVGQEVLWEWRFSEESNAFQVFPLLDKYALIRHNETVWVVSVAEMFAARSNAEVAQLFSNPRLYLSNYLPGEALDISFSFGNNSPSSGDSTVFIIDGFDITAMDISSTGIASDERFETLFRLEPDSNGNGNAADGRSIVAISDQTAAMFESVGDGSARVFAIDLQASTPTLSSLLDNPFTAIEETASEILPFSSSGASQNLIVTTADANNLSTLTLILNANGDTSFFSGETMFPAVDYSGDVQHVLSAIPETVYLNAAGQMVLSKPEIVQIDLDTGTRVSVGSVDDDMLLSSLNALLLSQSFAEFEFSDANGLAQFYLFELGQANSLRQVEF